MAHCPVCNSEIKDDFGLVTCSSCGAQVMVEIDGAAAMPEVDSMPMPEVAAMPVPEVDSMPMPPLPLESAVYSASHPVDAPRSPERLLKEATPDLSDIADFGNSESSLGREGMLRFDLFIVGIDSADVRQMVKEALMDERFLWNPEKIMEGVKDGQLQLSEITAVKSALLVQKLRAVPVEIRWEQYAIHQN